MVILAMGEEIALKKQYTGRKAGVRGQNSNTQKEEKPPVGTWKVPQEEHLCLRRAGSGGTQLSRDTAKADKKGNRTRAGRSLGLVWNTVRTVAGTVARSCRDLRCGWGRECG